MPFTEQELLAPNWKIILPMSILRDLTHASYNSARLKSCTSGRWHELIHIAVADGLGSRTCFLDGGQLFNFDFTLFFTRFLTVFSAYKTFVTILL